MENRLFREVVDTCVSTVEWEVLEGTVGSVETELLGKVVDF